MGTAGSDGSMKRHIVLVGIFSGLCGCSFFSPQSAEPPKDVARAPEAPTASAPRTAAGNLAYVTWDMNQLMPCCPGCNTEVRLHSTTCPRCYTDFRWHDMPAEDTPRGAFDRLKLAEIYNDTQAFRACVCMSDIEGVENALKRASTEGRETLLEPQVVDERVDGDRAQITVVQHGQRATLDLVREGGAWKISLHSLRQEALSDGMRLRVTQLAKAIERWEADHGAPPSAETWIRDLHGRDAKGRPYFNFNGFLDSRTLAAGSDPHARDAEQHVVSDELADPWWGGFVYRPGVSDGRRDFLLYSKGPNALDDGGSGDDILPK